MDFNTESFVALKDKVSNIGCLHGLRDESESFPKSTTELREKILFTINEKIRHTENQYAVLKVAIDERKNIIKERLKELDGLIDKFYERHITRSASLFLVFCGIFCMAACAQVIAKLLGIAVHSSSGAFDYNILRQIVEVIKSMVDSIGKTTFDTIYFVLLALTIIAYILHAYNLYKQLATEKYAVLFIAAGTFTKGGSPVVLLLTVVYALSRIDTNAHLSNDTLHIIGLGTAAAVASIMTLLFGFVSTGDVNYKNTKRIMVVLGIIALISLIAFGLAPVFDMTKIVGTQTNLDIRRLLGLVPNFEPMKGLVVGLTFLAVLLSFSSYGIAVGLYHYGVFREKELMTKACKEAERERQQIDDKIAEYKIQREKNKSEVETMYSELEVAYSEAYQECKFYKSLNDRPTSS